MYFLRGTLPWMNLKGNNKKDKYERIKEIKMQTPLEILCKGFPQEFVKYFQYVKGGGGGEGGLCRFGIKDMNFRRQKRKGVA